MSHSLIIWLVVAVLAIFVVTLFNRLVALRQNRNNAFADIDVQLKQRYDLVPRLVETVKGYAAHEKDILEAVTQARAQVGQVQGTVTPDRLQAEASLGGAIGRLLAVSENYPQLKADTNFRQLMDELTDIENKIAASRRYFNNATSEYNTATQSFPANIVAGLFGFKAQPFFELSADEKDAVNKAPDVKF